MSEMRAHFIVLALLFFRANTSAQADWAAAGMPFETLGFYQLYNDTSADVLYAAGPVQGALGGGWAHTVLLKYDGTTWTTLGDFNNHICTVVNYHDTLVVGGGFSSVEGVSASCITYYDGSTWRSMGVFDSSVRKLRIFNGELYAAGAFRYVDSTQVNCVAKWNGTAWEPVGLPPMAFTSGQAYDVQLYDGDLYLGGSYSMVGGYQDIMMYDGSSWQPVGGGLQGGANWVYRMEVFNGELYVGGLFFNGDGNAGNAIMRWNGTAWHSVGTGIQAYTGTYHQNLQVHSLKVHDNKLFVGGGQFFAGNVPSIAISTWDGDRWCNVGDAFFDWNVVNSIEFYHDTLFIATGNTIEGDTVNFIAKWIGGAYSDTCSVPMAIGDHGTLFASFTVLPNPAADVLNLAWRAAALPRWLVLHDALGREVLRLPWPGDGRVDVAALRSGAYHLQAIDARGAALGGARFVRE